MISREGEERRGKLTPEVGWLDVVGAGGHGGDNEALCLWEEDDGDRGRYYFRRLAMALRAGKGRL
jgi:hypothetical protein